MKISTELKTVFLAVLFAISFSCERDGEKGPQVSILNVISGGEQTGEMNQPLAQPLVLQLSTADGQPIAGASIDLAVRTFSGSIPQETLVTDGEGKVSVQWTLGITRDNRLDASFTGNADYPAAQDLNLIIEAPFHYNTPISMEDGWATQNASEAGLDTDMLERMVDRIYDGAFLSIHSIAIVKDNKLVFENYFPETWPPTTRMDDILPSRENKHLTFSVTKSVLSALMGIAIDEGLISLNAPIYSFFDYESYQNWDPNKMSITIEDALTMQTGLGCSENAAWEFVEDPTKYTLDLPLTGDPGGTFNYCTEVSNVLGEILEKVTGRSLQSYARSKLFRPLGIMNENWWIIQNRATAGSSLYWSTRDMLKFGQMYLDGGSWKGKQVVPSEWVNYSTTQQVNSGWDHNYALHWWKSEFRHKGIPYETTSALGVGGQRIFIIHDLNVVIAMTGGNVDITPEPTISSEVVNDYIMKALQ